MQQPEKRLFRITQENHVVLDEFADKEGVGLVELIEESVGTFSSITAVIAENFEHGVEATEVFLEQPGNTAVTVDVMDILTQPQRPKPEFDIPDPFKTDTHIELPELDSTTLDVIEQLASFYGLTFADILQTAISFHWLYCEQERLGLAMLIPSHVEDDYYNLTA